MKTFSQYVVESFDNPYNNSLKKVSPEEYVSKVKLPDGSELEIIFAGYIFDDDEPMDWAVVFTRDGSYAATGEGDQMRVFATVLDATKKFIKKVKPEKMNFTASKLKGNSRANLYKRLVSRFASEMGYTVDSITSDKRDDVFYLKKKK